MGIPLRDFTEYFRNVIHRLTGQIKSSAEELDRPVVYLPSARDRKGNITKEFLFSDSVNGGLVCALKVNQKAAYREVKEYFECETFLQKIRETEGYYKKRNRREWSNVLAVYTFILPFFAIPLIFLPESHILRGKGNNNP